MKKFTDYYLEMEQQTDQNIEVQKDTSSENKINAFKVAMKKFPEEVKHFLANLAEKDDQVKMALNGGGFDDNSSSDDKDEVVPPSADGSPGLDSGQGE